MTAEHAIEHIGGHATNRKTRRFAGAPCRRRLARLLHCGEVLLAAAAGLRQINVDANVKHSRSTIAGARGSRERAAGRQPVVAGGRRSRARRSCGTANRARQYQSREFASCERSKRPRRTRPHALRRLGSQRACIGFLNVRYQVSGSMVLSIPDPCHLVTTTRVPMLTRLYKSMMSSLYIRIQPWETKPPIVPGALVP